MRIGQLAEMTGVSCSSIRFYEKHGLIPEPLRQENGYRDYPEGMVSRIRTIAMSKSLGFSLAEIRRFLPDDPGDRIEREDVVVNLRQKLADVDHKMRDLREIRNKLVEMLEYMSDPNSEGC